LNTELMTSAAQEISTANIRSNDISETLSKKITQQNWDYLKYFSRPLVLCEFTSLLGVQIYRMQCMVENRRRANVFEQLAQSFQICKTCIAHQVSHWWHFHDLENSYTFKSEGLSMMHEILITVACNKLSSRVCRICHAYCLIHYSSGLYTSVSVSQTSSPFLQ
jgi:hypothetical protein